MKQIALKGKRGEGLFTLVDDDIYDYLNSFNWTLDSGNYAQRGIKTDKGWSVTRMHRDILKLRPHEVGDHINRIRLDNRKVNLRKCTHKENTRNTSKRKTNNSGYIGVSINSRQKIYEASITVNGKHIHLGGSKSVKELARLYDLNAIKYFGEFASLNFPLDNYAGLVIEDEIAIYNKIFKRRVQDKKTSKYKGVYWSKSKKSFQVEIRTDGKKLNLGTYHDERTAALIYDQSAREYLGDLAETNFNIHSNLPRSKRMINIPMDEIIKKYNEGQTMQRLAQEYGLVRKTLMSRFQKMGIPIRSYRDAQLLSNKNKTPEELRRQTQAAHLARRKINELNS